jgi:hypothetical protein
VLYYQLLNLALFHTASSLQTLLFHGLAGDCTNFGAGARSFFAAEVKEFNRQAADETPGDRGQDLKLLNPQQVKLGRFNVVILS